VVRHGVRKLLILEINSVLADVYFSVEHRLYSRSLRAKTEPKMSKLHMIDVVVSRLQQSGTYWDETTPGFGIRAGKNRKSWVIMRGQIRQRLRIGHYPAMPLAAARKEAKRLLTEAPTRNPAMSFATAYEEYRQSIATLRPKTQTEYKRLLDKYFGAHTFHRRVTSAAIG
jgi:Arm DNA-binding domain